MRAKESETPWRVQLGRYVIADSRICGGQPTFKGTRIMLWLVLEQLEQGLTWDQIAAEWKGRVKKAGIAEAIAVSPFVVKHKPFRGFHVGARRKHPRQPAAMAARS